jgi:hypothetical protein
VIQKTGGGGDTKMIVVKKLRYSVFKIMLGLVKCLFFKALFSLLFGYLQTPFLNYSSKCLKLVLVLISMVMTSA